MSENIKLSYVWDHTIKKILNHDLQSKMGIKIKEWVIFNKLEDINSLLKYTDHNTLQEFYNLRWLIQHLIDENEYQFDDDQWTNPLSESNWTYQTNKTFIKYVNFS